MSTVHAYATNEVNGTLKPFEYELGTIGSDEVDIAVDSCGICHSYLSMIEDVWEMTQYPLVPGHEMIGNVSAVGDRVGLDWPAGRGDNTWRARHD